MHEKIVGCVVACLATDHGAVSQSCLRPIPPFVPERVEDISAYAGLLKQDIEAYFADVQSYFRCIDTERGKVFVEAERVTEEFERVLEFIE